MATGGGNWMWFTGCEWNRLIYFAASYVILKELCSIFSFVRQCCMEFDNSIEERWLWPGDLFIFFVMKCLGFSKEL